MICECDNDTVPGACWPMGTDGDTSLPWVERCDNCQRFDSDDAAAEAVAKFVNGRVMYASLRADNAVGENLRPFVYPNPQIVYVVRPADSMEDIAVFADENDAFGFHCTYDADEIGDIERATVCDTDLATTMIAQRREADEED